MRGLREMRLYKKASISELIDESFFIEPLKKYIHRKFPEYNPQQLLMFGLTMDDLMNGIIRRVLSIPVTIEYTSDIRDNPSGNFHTEGEDYGITISNVNLSKFRQDKALAGYSSYVLSVIFHELTHAIDYIKKLYNEVNYNPLEMGEKYYYDPEEMRAYYSMMKDFLEDTLKISPKQVARMMGKYTTDMDKKREEYLKNIREVEERVAYNINWYKKSKLNKKATMDVRVSDFDYPVSKKTISDIGNYLQNYILYKTDFYNQLTDFEKAYWKKNKVPEFITMDGFDVDAETGTINIYLVGLPERTYSVIYDYLIKLLTKEGFKFEATENLEDSKMFKSKVMRIKVLDNPYANQIEDKPPELNMANENAKLIFEKVLKYNLSDSFLEIPVFDIVNRINKITEEKIEENERPWSRNWGPGKVEMISGGLYSEDIKERLNRIKQIAQWALDHGYKRIYVA
jgi:hypothetical protein